MLDRSLGFMASARDHIGGAPQVDGRLHLVFPGDALSVRSALKTALQALRGMSIANDRAAVVEIVLAEVLNNVVEHAYADDPHGVIELEVAGNGHLLTFVIRDDGRPMPGGNTPGGRPQDLDVAAEDLPEGGFGWFLIRKLTRDLVYQRSDNRNELRFFIPLGDRTGQ